MLVNLGRVITTKGFTMTRIRLLIIAVCVTNVKASVGEPCETNNFIDNWKRSTAYIPMDGNFICDSLIPENWYRVISGAGELMPTECIHGGWRCGTVYPIYLSKEDVPDDEDMYPPTGSEVERKAYSVDDTNCKFKDYSIRIKNCSLYNVYFLQRTQGCDSAYCFGFERPCPDGQLSETGFTPGCSDEYPSKVLNPKLTVGMHKELIERKTFLTPIFQCEADDATDQYSYDIQYYINDVHISSAVYVNISYNDIENATLFQRHWEGTFRPNMFVKCSMQARYIDRGVPGEKHYSENFFAGIKALGVENGFVLEEGTSGKIEVEVTLPIGCSYIEKFKSQACYVGLRNGIPQYQENEDCAQESNLEFTEKSCVLKIPHDEWNTKRHTVEVTAPSDQIVTSADRLVFLRLYTGILSTNNNDMLAIWKEFTLPDIKIYIKDTDKINLGSSCYSRNDPHMRIFDGRTWELQGNHNQGEYIMYKHISLPQQINAYFRPCNSRWNALCNCGVAVRSADSLFIANFCTTGSITNRRTNRYVASRLCDGQNLVVEEIGENGYKITLPSGTTVEFYHGEVRFGDDDAEYGIHNIHITPSTLDFKHTIGLCGTYNNRDTDDFVRKGTTFPEIPVNEFAQSWKVTDQKESFYDPSGILPPISYTPQEYCTCKDGETAANFNCKMSDQVRTCTNTDLTTTVYHTSCISSAHTLRKRSTDTDIESDDDAPPMYPMVTEVDDTIDMEPSGWRNGITEDTARTKCESHIRGLPAYSACTDYVPTVNGTTFIEECVADMKITGSDSFLETTLQIFQGSCLSDAKKIQNLTETNTTTSTGETKSIFTAIAESSCPKNCSGKGICKEGVCKCIEGSYGHDCSLDKSKAPRLLRNAIEGQCSSFKKPCKKFAFPGIDFVASNLTCKFRMFKVLKNGTLIVDIDNFTNRGIYFSSFLMYCELPDTRKKRSVDEEVASTGYYISVSNDGKNFTEEVIMMVLDTRCFECNSTSLQCSELDTCPSVSKTPITSHANYLGLGVGIGAVVFLILVIFVAVCLRKKYMKRKPYVSDSSLNLPNPNGWCAEKPVLQSTDIFMREKTYARETS